MVDYINDIQTSFECYVINMPKDRDRRSRIEKQLGRVDIQATFVNGVVASEVHDDVKGAIFTPKCVQSCGNSIMGCAMAHINTIARIRDGTKNFGIILEDDANLTNGFTRENIRMYINEAKTFDILLLGCLHGCGKRDPLITQWMNNFPKKRVINISDHLIKPDYFTGLHGYVLSRRGAEKIINSIKQDQVYNHIDLYLNHLYRKGILDVKALQTHIVHQTLNDSNNASYGYIDKLLVRLVTKDFSLHPYYTNVYGEKVYGIPKSLKNTTRIMVIALFAILYMYRKRVDNYQAIILLILVLW